MVVDTDVMIDILRGHPPACEWLDSLANAVLLVPGYVAMELIQGCVNKQNQQRVQRLINECPIIWPDESTCAKALNTFTKVHLSHKVGFLDCLIGHTALELESPIYTFNQKHYSQIKGLKVIQPYQRLYVAPQ